MLLDFTDDQSSVVQVMAWCIRQQAITWASVDPDLCRHMVSLGQNELIVISAIQYFIFYDMIYVLMLSSSFLESHCPFDWLAYWDLYLATVCFMSLQSAKIF